MAETSITKVPVDISEAVEDLRAVMRTHNIAFGAVYAVWRNVGDTILMDEHMPQSMRVQMLKDMIKAAQNALERYRV